MKCNQFLCCRKLSLLIIILYNQCVCSFCISNIHLVGFGKAVFGMAVELHSLIGEHIKKGIISVPVGTVSTAIQSNAKSVQPFLKDERIKYVVLVIFITLTLSSIVLAFLKVLHIIYQT